MTDTQLSQGLKQIVTTYPRWMDKADSVGVSRFRELVRQAKTVHSKCPAYGHGVQAERWRGQARLVIESMEILERRVSSGVRIEVEA